MNNIERRDQQILYISDDAVFEEQKKCRSILQKLNFMDRADFSGISALVKELFGTSDGAFLNPPFYCDYGSHIHVGKNFFANYNCTIIDVAPVTIGDNCQMAPNVAIYTAGHPVHPATRNTAYEYGIEVNIGHNVWIGGNSVILPGVHIGDNSVIGAGSVVTKDIPAWCVAAGNPCRVIRKITEADRESFFRHVPVDPAALDHMRQIWANSDDSIRYPSAPEPPFAVRRIKEHPGKGARILGSMPELVTGARSHHERFDGRGYPDGLKGLDIPEEARIIAVADAYNAMTSNRNYR